MHTFPPAPGKYDSGASTLEWSALILVAAAILTALWSAIYSAPLQQQIDSALCQMFDPGRDCADSRPQADTPQSGGNDQAPDSQGDKSREDSTRENRDSKEDKAKKKNPKSPDGLTCDRSINVSDYTISGNYKNYRAEGKGMDYLTQKRDQVTGKKKSVYTTHGTSSLGLAKENKKSVPSPGKIRKMLNSSNREWGSFAEAGTGSQLNYEFSGEDSWKKGNKLQDRLRGKQGEKWVSAAAGGGGPFLDDGRKMLVDSAKRGKGKLILPTLQRSGTPTMRTIPRPPGVKGTTLPSFRSSWKNEESSR